MLKLIITLALLVTGSIAEAQQRTCQTTCYGNTCTTRCY
jgi:hypothetical protein